MPRARVSPYLAVWTVISLRPAAQQAAMRRAIRARGATALALPALRLAAAGDPDAARAALQEAQRCAQLIYTSPAAVRYAAALAPLSAHRGQRVYALGAGGARLLARHGVAARSPAAGAMHSEGLLALPDFASGRGAAAVGLVTAPGGRGLLARRLRERGARVVAAEVYRRLPPRFDRRHADALRAAAATPCALLLTSAEALDQALAHLPPEAAEVLRGALVVASSERLRAHALACGCRAAILAPAPTPAALLDALHAHVGALSG